MKQNVMEIYLTRLLCGNLPFIYNCMMNILFGDNVYSFTITPWCSKIIFINITCGSTLLGYSVYFSRHSHIHYSHIVTLLIIIGCNIHVRMQYIQCLIFYIPIVIDIVFSTVHTYDDRCARCAHSMYNCTYIQSQKLICNSIILFTHHL